MPKQGKASRGNRYSVANKQDILRRFDELMSSEKEKTAPEIAKELDVALSTIYRWIASRRPAKRDQVQKNEILDRVEKSIAILSSDAGADDPQVRHAVFEFAYWLRWPNDLDNMSLTVAALHIAYLLENSTHRTMGDLPEDILYQVARLIEVDTLRRMFSDKRDYINTLTNHPLGMGDYSEKDFLYQVGEYFVSGSLHGFPVSIEKAAYLCNFGLLDSRYQCSTKTFRDKWRVNAVAIPFIFVELSTVGLDWELVPEADDFHQRTRSLLQRRKEVRDYFAASRWAVETMSTALDKRAFARLRFPEFPSHVSSMPLVVRNVAEKIRRSMQIGRKRVSSEQYDEGIDIEYIFGRM